MSQQILDFWFQQLSPKQWWAKDQQLDSFIADEYGKTHAGATAGELWSWRETAEGRLAEIIVLDQFSRNIYRDTPQAFASDKIALVLAQEAIQQHANQMLSASQKSFMYMPFMHSESAKIHERAMELFSEPGLENNFDFEKKHKVIIDRFGRYPHRNKILDRTSTEEELKFLNEPGSSF